VGQFTEIIARLDRILGEDTPLSIRDKAPGAKYALIHDIYEEDTGSTYPVVRHIFYGKTSTEVRHYLQSHMKTDSFLGNCQRSGKWSNVKCRTTSRVVRLP
jgi:hypothetical protein